MEIKQFIGSNYGWVDENGSYGVSAIAVFDSNALTEDQWDVLSELGDNDRFDYVSAILQGEDLSEWEDN